MERLKSEVPRTRHRKRRGVDSGKGVSIPSRIRSLGNVASSPSMVRGRAPTENEFGYSIAVRSFHSLHNVVDRGVLQAIWEELAGKVVHRDQLIIC